MASSLSKSSAPTKEAGAWDIRTVIGGLLTVYGVILLVTGLWFTSAADKAKVDGANLNLLVSIGLLAAGLLFIAWAKLRPLRVPVDDAADDVADDDGPAGP